MSGCLHVSTLALANWLGSIFPRVSKDWWKECVLSELNSVQLEHIDHNKIYSLSQFNQVHSGQVGGNYVFVRNSN